MERLRIRLFGGFRMSMAGDRLPAFATREAQQIFAFLLLHRDRHFSREALGETFFADQTAVVALKRLRTAIWRIRSVLEPEGTEAGTYLTVTNREVGFNDQSHYWLDIEEFEEKVSSVTAVGEAALKDKQASQLLQALDLYRGDLLEGIYDEWCVWEQERLKMLHLRGLEMLMAHHAASTDWDSAIVRGQQLLSYDPLREHIHRSLMRYYYLVGDRPAALVQYNGCAQLLMDELGIEPMRETSNLFQAIKDECALADLADEQQKLRETVIQPGTVTEQDGLAELYNSADQIAAAARHLRRGIAWVEEFIDESR